MTIDFLYNGDSINSFKSNYLESIKVKYLGVSLYNVFSPTELILFALGQQVDRKKVISRYIILEDDDTNDIDLIFDQQQDDYDSSNSSSSEEIEEEVSESEDDDSRRRRRSSDNQAAATTMSMYNDVYFILREYSFADMITYSKLNELKEITQLKELELLTLWFLLNPEVTLQPEMLEDTPEELTRKVKEGANTQVQSRLLEKINKEYIKEITSLVSIVNELQELSKVQREEVIEAEPSIIESMSVSEKQLLVKVTSPTSRVNKVALSSIFDRVELSDKFLYAHFKSYYKVKQVYTESELQKMSSFSTASLATEDVLELKFMLNSKIYSATYCTTAVAIEVHVALPTKHQSEYLDLIVSFIPNFEELAVSTLEVSISGMLECRIQSNNYIWRHLCMVSPLISYFFYMNESRLHTRSCKTQPSHALLYSNQKDSNAKFRINAKSEEYSTVLFTKLHRWKANIEILKMCLYFYNFMLENILSIYSTLLPESVFDEAFICLKDEEKLKTEPTALEKRRLLGPELIGTANYSRRCAKPPAIVESDSHQRSLEREGKELVAFPREAIWKNPLDKERGVDPDYPQRLYYCTYDDYKFVGLMTNRQADKEWLEYIPCCYKLSHKDKPQFINYYADTKFVKENKYKMRTIMTKKILQPGIRGAVNSTYFVELVRSIDPFFEVYRVGVNRTPSSLLECCLLARLQSLGEGGRMTLQEEVVELREHIANTPKYLDMLQVTMFNNTRVQIKELLLDPEQYLNPRDFLFVVEDIFNINLIVFDEKEFVIPHYKFFYNYSFDPERSTLVLLEHIGSKEYFEFYPQCEVISSMDSFILPRVITDFLHQLLTFKSTMLFSFTDKQRTEKSDLPVALEDIESQVIDSGGLAHLISRQGASEYIRLPFPTKMLPCSVDDDLLSSSQGENLEKTFNNFINSESLITQLKYQVRDAYIFKFFDKGENVSYDIDQFISFFAEHVLFTSDISLPLGFDETLDKFVVYSFLEYGLKYYLLLFLSRFDHYIPASYYSLDRFKVNPKEYIFMHRSTFLYYISLLQRNKSIMPVYDSSSFKVDLKQPLQFFYHPSVAREPVLLVKAGRDKMRALKRSYYWVREQINYSKEELDKKTDPDLEHLTIVGWHVVELGTDNIEVIVRGKGAIAVEVLYTFSNEEEEKELHIFSILKSTPPNVVGSSVG